jgi:SsrA-binding protein
MAKTAKPTQQPQQKKTDAKEAPPIKLISDNRRARFEYEIVQVYECGIELTGTEVKSMRQGKANLQDSFARVEQGELWLFNCHISPYEFGNRFNHDPVRKRRLLMHKREITKIKSQLAEKGLTLIPLKLYFKRNWVKVDLALARGRQLFDKRENITKRETKRQLERVVKGRR